MTETVEVQASNSLLDAGSANLATTLSTQEVTDLPNLGRNPFVLATLAAGVLDTGAYFTGKASGFTNPFSGSRCSLADVPFVMLAPRCDSMAGMKKVLGLLSILEFVAFFALLRYGSATHKEWPDGWR